MPKMILQISDPVLVQKYNEAGKIMSEAEMKELKQRIMTAWKTSNSEVEPDGRQD